MNLDKEPPENNCLMQAVDTDLSPGILAIAVGVKNDRDFRDTIDQQVNTVLTVAEDFKAALDSDHSQACPHCGYPTACISRTVCRMRSLFFTKLNEQRLRNSITAPEFWYMVVHTPAVFLPPRLRKQAKTLISQKAA